MRRKTIWGRVCTAVLILSLLAGAVAVVFTGGRVRPPDPLPEQAQVLQPDRQERGGSGGTSDDVPLTQSPEPTEPSEEPDETETAEPSTEPDEPTDATSATQTTQTPEPSEEPTRSTGGGTEPTPPRAAVCFTTSAMTRRAADWLARLGGCRPLGILSDHGEDVIW